VAYFLGHPVEDISYNGLAHYIYTVSQKIGLGNLVKLGQILTNLQTFFFIVINGIEF